MDNIVFLSLFFNVLILILLFVLYRKTASSNQSEQLLGIKLQLDQLRNDLYRQQEGLRSELNRNMQETMNNFGSIILKTLRSTNDTQNGIVKDMDKNMQEKLDQNQRLLSDSLSQVEKRLQTYSAESTAKLENIRLSVERKLGDLQADNNKKLDDMRQLVDEKLQKTLNERMTESFKLVNDRLEQVYKGLGEMQSLAQGVGDLKKVMSNVKTRGILGEIQLGAILEEILSAEQYAVNIETKKGIDSLQQYISGSTQSNYLQQMAHSSICR